MGYITGVSREQQWLEARCLDDFVDKDNIVRVIDLFIEQQDFEGMGFEKAVVKATGRPPYDPKQMAKLYVYGYLNRVRSSRRLEAEAGRNVEVMWLMEGLRPDDKTISNFRTDNRKALKELFKRFNRFCQSIEMFGNETCAIDGTKVEASNGRKRYHTLKDTTERLVPRPHYKLGYKYFSLTLASEEEKCQSTCFVEWLRDFSQAERVSFKALMQGIRLLKHCRVTTLNSISAMLSQLPCLGV